MMSVFFTGHHHHRVIWLLLLVLLRLGCRAGIVLCPDENSAACENNNSEEGTDNEDVLPLDGTEVITFSRPGPLPDREYYVYTPTSYHRQSSSAAGVVIAFHGWGGSGRSWTMDEDTRAVAEAYNYVIVAPTGLKGSNNEYNSWQNQGSNTGFDPTGTAPICDVNQRAPDYCYESCQPCRNRCYWTHCVDDDVQFVHDLLVGNSDNDSDDGFVNALSDLFSFDTAKVFAIGSSNGGMFVWTLLQDPRTAGLFRAAAPIIGLPHCGYGLPATDGVARTPIISITGKDDDTVSPSNLPWPGTPSDTCIVNRDGDRYYYVPSHHIVTEWAAYGGCTVEKTEPSFPDRPYLAGTTFNDDDLACKTWCHEEPITNEEGVVVVVPPYAVDCAFEGGHEHPIYATEAAFHFFRGHSTMTTHANNSNDADADNAHDEIGSEKDTHSDTAPVNSAVAFNTDTVSNVNTDGMGETVIASISSTSSPESISVDANQAEESLVVPATNTHNGNDATSDNAHDGTGAEKDPYSETTAVAYVVASTDTVSTVKTDDMDDTVLASIISSTSVPESISLDANQAEETLVVPTTSPQPEKKEKKTKEKKTKDKKEHSNRRRIRK